jgi:DNA repair protein RecN (Recombination protein N)
MIIRLHIEDFAIVSDLSVDFFPAMNILSGETGAGKSIIIGALNLLLGERAQTEMIRTGKDQAIVEGQFAIRPQIWNVLKKSGIEGKGKTLEIRREIRRNASSRCFLNGQMCTVADLKEIGQRLVDLVGQHHQQLLLNPENHIGFLDQFAGNNDLLEKYHLLHKKYNSAKAELSELENRIAHEKEKSELYRFQLQEIESAKLSLEEEQELTEERQILENAETLKSAYYAVSERIYHGEGSITELLKESLDTLEPLKKFDGSLEQILRSIKSSMFDLQEAGRTLESRSQEIEHDPERLRAAEERLDIYYDLKKKYGGSLDDLFQYRDKIQASLESFRDRSDQIADLKQAIKQDLAELSAIADKLSSSRHKSAKKLAGLVESELEKLLMGRVEFEVQIKENESPSGEYKRDIKNLVLGIDGYDIVEFMFSPNPGEENKSLAKIASGGELSRVLLAIKTIISSKSNESCLIFDEIDSGIGGKTASAVGKSLQSLAQKHQVIVITHLQQIAAFGENHFLVFKEKSDGRMITRIRKLTLKQRKEEIGRMISGEKITDLSIKQAEELLDKKAK